MATATAIRRSLIQGVALAATLAALAFTFRDVRLDRVLAELERLGPAGMALVLSLPWVALLLETAAWRAAFAVIGSSPSFSSLLWVRVVTEALVLSLPGGVVVAEPAKIPLLTRHAGMDAPTAVAGTLARKYLLLAAQALWIAVAAALGLAYFVESAQPRMSWVGIVFAAAFILGIVAAIMRMQLAGGSLLSRLRGVLSRLPVRALQQKLAVGGNAFGETEGRLSRFFAAGPAREASVTAVCVLAWAAETLETYLLLRLLGVELDFGVVAMIEVVLALARSIAFVLPAGIGIQDVGFALLLREFGVPDALELGMAFTLLRRSKEVALVVLGFSLMGMFPARGTARTAKPSDAAPAL